MAAAADEHSLVLQCNSHSTTIRGRLLWALATVMRGVQPICWDEAKTTIVSMLKAWPSGDLMAYLADMILDCYDVIRKDDHRAQGDEGQAWAVDVDAESDREMEDEDEEIEGTHSLATENTHDAFKQLMRSPCAGKTADLRKVRMMPNGRRRVEDSTDEEEPKKPSLSSRLKSQQTAKKE